MKRDLFILTMMLSVLLMKAQSPASCFRNWQGDPVRTVRKNAAGFHSAFEVYYNSRYAAYRSYSIDPDLAVMKQELESRYDHPLFYGSYSPPLHFVTPHSAFFCRMENYTSAQWGIMMSLHTGGFCEQDDIDQH